MSVSFITAPRGNFYCAKRGNLAAFDRDRAVAIRKLAEAVWRSAERAQ